MNKACLISIMVVVVCVMSLGCIEKPTVEVTDIALRDVSITSTTIDVEFTINNPNPIDVRLNKITYDVYLVNGNQLFLAKGEKAEPMDIQANDRTTIDVPTSISNVGTIEALCLCILEEKLPKIKVTGTASMDLMLFSIDVPFEKTISVSEKLRERIREESIVEEATEIIEEVVEEIPKKKLDVNAPSSADVDELITITVTVDGEPVEGATVKITGVLSKETYTTNRYGEVTWEPDERGTYDISAKKAGYYPSVVNVIRISLGEVEISNVDVNPSYNSATFSWETDKPAICELWIDGNWHGVSPYARTEHQEEAFLESGETYTFVIEVVDGEGRYEETFTTKSYWPSPSPSPTLSPSPSPSPSPDGGIIIYDVEVDPSYNSATFSWKTDKTATCELWISEKFR